MQLRHLEADLACVKFCGVREKRAPMRSVIVTLVLGGGAAIVASTTTVQNFVPQSTALLASAIVEGVILGATPWPSTPIDAQARLRLASTACDLNGRCAVQD
jgi:hypothetical protein